MADPKDGESFFRKVVRFVANPATDWNEIQAGRSDDLQDVERSEVKAMVERKRRNDFVRKREFDMLRKLRREGLSPEQLAALGGSSRVDDSEARLSEASSMRSEGSVKDKIDAIEQQMVGEGGMATRRPGEPGWRTRSGAGALSSDAPTRPQAFDPARSAPPARPSPAPRGEGQMAPAPGARKPAEAPASRWPTHPGPSTLPARAAADTAAGLPEGLGGGAAPSTATPSTLWPGELDRGPQSSVDLRLDGDEALEVNEVVHDPEFDEAVIAFANADFAHSEHALEQLRRPGGPRHGHVDTWLVLFDLYRATAQQAKFEALAMDFAARFDRSAPQWYSLPQLVAEAAAVEEQHRPASTAARGEIGWSCPAVLDADAVARLRSATLQLPLPWVLDWSALERVEPEGAGELAALLRLWAPQRLDMRWMGYDRLQSVLRESSPTGVRDADPAFWMARLETLRLVNRPDQFDETAIDYCVTYEVSPPSWEPAAAQARPMGAGPATSPPSLSFIGDAASSFLESRLDDHHPALPITTVELSGQLAGDIGDVLRQIDRKLGSATLVQVSCARLIRVDFIAAGDLLNWVLAKRSENRSVTFCDAQRLVALFFGAMGINEHARVQVSRV